MPTFQVFVATSRAEWRRALPLLVLIPLVWLLEQTSLTALPQFARMGFLAAHTSAEVVAVVLASLSFGLLWMAPDSPRRPASMLLTAVMGGAAVLDFLHMLSYDGMPPLVTPSGVEKSIAFWLAGRALVAFGLLVMAITPPATRPQRGYPRLSLGLVGCLVAISSALILFWPDLLPRTFEPGQGLTAAKVGSEMALIALLLATALRLEYLGRRGAGVPMTAMAIAAVLSAIAEGCFATYSSPTDIFNALGHIAKIAAYGYLTRAAYLLAVRQPLQAAGGIADALQATLNPALICDEDGTIVWMNPAFVQVTGYEAQALLGRELDVLRVPGDEQAWAQMREAMIQAQPWKGQVQVRRLNGSIYLDDRSVTPMRGSQGHLNGFVILGDDVTERHRVERELIASEERMRALLSSAPDAVVVIDAQGHIQMVNHAVERMFGFSSDELLGANVNLLMPDGVARQHDDFVQHYMATGERHIIGVGRDMQARRRDGRELHVQLTVGEARLSEGSVFIGFMRDISERVQVQKALAEREARYRALMDTALDGVWICDEHGRFLEVNDAYVQMSGYSRTELLRMRIPDVNADDQPGHVNRHIQITLVSGHDRFETQHRRKDGEHWPVEITTSRSPLGGGHFFVFVRDLSERRAAAQALRQSEERFELALRGTNDGLWDRNLIDGSVYLSPRCEEMLGYHEGELRVNAETASRLIHPSDALALHLALGDVVAGRSDERFEIETRLRHKNGHWVDVLSRGQLLRDASGTPVRMIGTVRDLTERKRAEQALFESEDKLRSLFELSPLGIALCTLDGNLVEFNEAYRALTGYSAEALQSLSYWDLTPSEYMRAEAEQLKMVARIGRYGPYDKEYVRADGSRVPVRLNGVRIELGGQAYLWSISEDLTVQRRIEAERQAVQQQQMQSQKLEALGHLTGGIAHDFNNMLAGIMGLASLGLERYVNDPGGKLAGYLREIVRTSERGRDLVAKMLAYVRTEEPEDVAPRQLGAMVSEMFDMLKSSIPSGILLSYGDDHPLPAVRISAVDVQQIVMNLVINARDALGASGHIDIRLLNAQLATESCSNCQGVAHGRFVVLEVTDDGPGIAPEVLPKIFDPFFTTKGVGKGTGLGLSSVVGLVHKAGGHIQVHDRTPHGTAMRVLLPAAQDLPVDEVAPRPTLDFVSGEAIWVVDDDPAVLVFLSELLREHGFTVSAFADPRRALAALGEALRQEHGAAPPAALITDQTMPGMSGVALFKAAQALCPSLGVIICTGYSEYIDAESARQMGVRHFLRKPFDSHELLEKIADMLGRGKA